MRNRVLIVDDSATTRMSVARFLAAKTFDVAESGSCTGALDQLRRGPWNVAIFDYALPDGTAFDLIEEWKQIYPACAVIVLTGHGSIDLAVKTLQAGADHFLTKPVDLPSLHTLIERLVEQQRDRQASRAVRSERRSEDAPFIGTSRRIRELRDEVERLRSEDLPVLILGETGSGKGVLARWLHDRSRRAPEAMVDLNCAGLTREFLETELFGHERGAFTGAMQAKEGLVEIADQGTLFLDEIGDVDLQIQPKLLKVLEEQRFRRLGETRDRVVDVRLVSATHHDLPRLVTEGRFRGDLFFRISTVTLHLPPLRERREDIPLLARELLTRGRTQTELSDAAVAALQAYDWPGNIRELRNVLERAVLIAGGAEIGPDHLQFQFSRKRSASTVSGGDTLVEVERAHIERILDEELRSVERACKRLGIPRNTLYYKMRKHGIRA
ncbi:MAG TPA: sigma-54 dependent transcriptional regulator [Thermoanaerobaculia bacterium]|nr:sigma-54 dependent transcriptional regulator [Thermoanaerobaculia bacterium]